MLFFRLNILLLWILNIADSLFTDYWLQNNLAVESNPFMLAAIESFGQQFCLFVLKPVLVLLASYILWKRRQSKFARIVIVPLCAFYLYVLALHISKYVAMNPGWF